MGYGRIEGIALDLEGTVVDVERAHHLAHLCIARKFDLLLTIDSAIAGLRHFIGGPDSKVIEDILDMAEISHTPDMVEELVREDVRLYESYLRSMEISARSGFMMFYETMRDLGIKMSIGSLTPRSQAEVLLKRSGLREMIGDGYIVLAEDVVNKKPAPDVYLETTRRMGIEPVNQLVFEDSPRGVQAGVAAGSQVVGMPVYPLGQTGGALIEAGASRVFCDWRELNAQSLIENLSCR